MALLDHPPGNSLVPLNNHLLNLLNIFLNELHHMLIKYVHLILSRNIQLRGLPYSTFQDLKLINCAEKVLRARLKLLRDPLIVPRLLENLGKYLDQMLLFLILSKYYPVLRFPLCSQLLPFESNWMNFPSTKINFQWLSQ